MSRFCKCRLRSGESPVQSRLAITPSQMMQLAENGIPIAAQQLPSEHFSEGDTSSSFDVLLDYQRGVDINTMWNVEQDVKKKMFSAYKQSEYMRNYVGKSE